ncbi:MAG: hypothetical protein ACPGXK_02755 [Phycisphaerae bacterium]
MAIILRLFALVCPELDRISTPRQKSALLILAYQPFFYAFAAILLLGPMVLADFLENTLTDWLGLTSTFSDLSGFLSFSLMMLTILVVFLFAGRGRARRFVRAELARQGIAICVLCGYDLTGISGTVCPECGASSHGHDDQVTLS